jgi:FkbM family methyltransferase
MFNYIKNKIIKRRLKRTFSEYNYNIVKFNLDKLGEIEYARWQHPLTSNITITQEMVNFTSQFISEGDFLIDIGAHSGDTTVPMALAAGAKGTVLALEPNPYVYKILEANANLNKSKTNILPRCFAATERDGKYKFNYSDASYCNGGFLSQIKNKPSKHEYILEVDGKNLENYLRENHAEQLKKLSLIKTDAEGYDKEIIKSLSSIIIECRPTIILECYRKLTSDERNDLYQTLSSLNYTLFRVNDFESKNTMMKLTIKDMNNWKHFDIAALPNEKTNLTNK